VPKPRQEHITLYQGSTFRYTVLLEQPDGSPVDLTGATARMQVRPRAGSDEVFLALTNDNGGITITPLEGKLELYVPADATIGQTWRRGVYQLEVEYATGDVYRYLEGNVEHSHEVTR